MTGSSLLCSLFVFVLAASSDALEISQTKEQGRSFVEIGPHHLAAAAHPEVGGIGGSGSRMMRREAEADNVREKDVPLNVPVYLPPLPKFKKVDGEDYIVSKDQQRCPLGYKHIVNRNICREAGIHLNSIHEQFDTQDWCLDHVAEPKAVGCYVDHNEGENKGCVHINEKNNKKNDASFEFKLNDNVHYICEKTIKTHKGPKAYWGEYVFELTSDPADCKALASPTGTASVFANSSETFNDLRLEGGTVQDHGQNALMMETRKGLRISKESCENRTTTTIAGRTKLPAGSKTVEALFAITDSCGADCAPFMIAVIDKDNQVKHRWCWNRQGVSPDIQCDTNKTVNTHSWQRISLDIADYVSDSEAGKLELGVYTSGDFAMNKDNRVTDDPPTGGKATVILDTLLIGPNKREKPDVTYTEEAFACRKSWDSQDEQSDLNPVTPRGKQICGTHDWCFDKFRCHNSFCIEAEGRCNGVYNCREDDSDEVGCSNWRGFHAEIFLNHAQHLAEWKRELKNGLPSSGIFKADVSLRILNDSIKYDAEDIWEKFHVHDNFAAIWTGTVVFAAGNHNFDYGGPGYRELRLTRQREKGEKEEEGDHFEITEPCEEPGKRYGCGGRSFRKGVYDVRLIYIQPTGKPSIRLEWWGTTTGGKVQAMHDAATLTQQWPLATMTGSTCRTHECPAGTGKKYHEGEILCKGVPCDLGDTPTCCAHQYSVIRAGEFFTCGLNKEQHLICWGTSRKGPNRQWTMHKEKYRDLSVRGKYICGVLAREANTNDKNQIDCFTPNSLKKAKIKFDPLSDFQSVSVGSTHICGLRNNGIPVCMSEYNFTLSQSVPMTLEFTQLKAGNNFTCGIHLKGDGKDHPAGTAQCWGDINKMQAFPPGCDPVHDKNKMTEYKSIEAGHDHACGILLDDTAVCWGRNTNSQTAVPTGTFKQIAPGVEHTCGIREDDTVVCWGSDEFGESSPPEKEHFKAISCGFHHSCGIRMHDDEVVCWGSNYMDGKNGKPVWSGQSEPPMAYYHDPELDELNRDDEKDELDELNLDDEED